MVHGIWYMTQRNNVESNMFFVGSDAPLGNLLGGKFLIYSWIESNRVTKRMFGVSS